MNKCANCEKEMPPVGVNAGFHLADHLCVDCISPKSMSITLTKNKAGRLEVTAYQNLDSMLLNQG